MVIQSTNVGSRRWLGAVGDDPAFHAAQEKMNSAVNDGQLFAGKQVNDFEAGRGSMASIACTYGRRR